jgi:predicted PurR-regulated permease PerM
MADTPPPNPPTPTIRDHTATQAAALVTIATLLVVAAVTYLGPVFKPFLIAFFLYFLVRSLVRSLERWNLPPVLSYLVILFLSLVVGAVILIVLSTQVAQLGKELAQPIYQRGIVNSINEKIDFTGYSLGDVHVPAADVFAYVFGQGLETLELLGLAIFYLLFMILGAGKFSHRVHQAVPEEHADHLFTIGEEITAGLEEFIKVKTFVGLGMAVTTGIILLLFGIKYWLLWSFLFFLLNYIHYIGSMAALIPPIALAFINFDHPLMVGVEPHLHFHEPFRAAAGIGLVGIGTREPYLQFNELIWASIIAGLLILNRFVWIDYVEIRLSGERLNIEPVLIFLWLTYWGWFWGVVGLILAYPMLATLRIVLDHIDATKRWAYLMGEE